jgi:hypothetical protein
MEITGYSELSKDAVYLLSRAEFEKQKVITTEYAVKVLWFKSWLPSHIIIF